MKEQQAKQLYDDGNGVRNISLRLGIPKCLVHFYVAPEKCNRRAWARILTSDGEMDATEVCQILRIDSDTLQTYLEGAR